MHSRSSAAVCTVWARATIAKGYVCLHVCNYARVCACGCVLSMCVRCALFSYTLVEPTITHTFIHTYIHTCTAFKRKRPVFDIMLQMRDVAADWKERASGVEDYKQKKKILVNVCVYVCVCACVCVCVCVCGSRTHIKRVHTNSSIEIFLAGLQHQR